MVAPGGALRDVLARLCEPAGVDQSIDLRVGFVDSLLASNLADGPAEAVVATASMTSLGAA